MFTISKKYFNKKYISTFIIFILIILLIIYFAYHQINISEHFTSRITTPLTPCKTRFIITSDNPNSVVSISTLSFNPTKNDVEEKLIDNYLLKTNEIQITNLLTSSTLGFVIDVRNFSIYNDSNITIAPYCKSTDYTNKTPTCNTNFGTLRSLNFKNSHRFYKPMSIGTITNTTYKYTNQKLNAFKISVPRLNLNENVPATLKKTCLIMKTENTSDEENTPFTYTYS